MQSSSPCTSTCRNCRFYTIEGRRGGNCQLLDVPVQGSWKSCSLAMQPFAPAWENLEEIMLWPQEILMQQPA
ncbi:hypothetical protein [Microcoleus sp. FACHB-672]|uniref:hypothetical protein n=1 Tax=Microcoleus sp. FACHB-672 TaxID=2692825 RepID=UPI001683BA2D|nr:hypothetical protein [Microcoleus sp. FACHB-672]MBD2040210.1 hypothetical protein [Microcoleus sp. FACHB-672]